MRIILESIEASQVLVLTRVKLTDATRASLVGAVFKRDGPCQASNSPGCKPAPTFDGLLGGRGMVCLSPG